MKEKGEDVIEVLSILPSKCQKKNIHKIKCNLLISELKDVISNNLQIPANEQVLFYQGQILNDNQTLKHYNIQNKDHITLLKQKDGITGPGDKGSQNPPPKSAPKPVIVIKDDNSNAKGGADNGLITKFVQMGFPEDQVKLAVNSSQGNPDLILDYLVNGTPKKVEVTYNNPRDNENNEREVPKTVTSLLQSHPAFPQLLQTLRTDPSQVEPLLINIVNSHPQLLTQISKNPLDILNILLTTKPLQGQPIDCDMKKEEKQAIEKLVSLGIPRNIALEIYISFDKNEDLAYNYLLSTDTSIFSK